MSCEEMRPLLAAWLDGELARETSREVEAHVAGCGECGRVVNSYRDMQQMFHTEEAAQREILEREILEGAQNDTTLWQNVQLQIQAEESAALRQELEQMRQMVHALQREVRDLRRQAAMSPQQKSSRFDALMPGTQPLSQSTNLRSLL